MPALCEDLLSSIDQPLKIAKDVASKRDYLLCDYNRDGDSYRCTLPLSHFFFFSVRAFAHLAFRGWLGPC